MKVQSPDQAGFAGELTIRAIKDGKMRVLGPFKNKVVSSSGYGRNLILRRLSNDNTYGSIINSAAVGDSNTAAADGDTNLGNPLVTGLDIGNYSITGATANVLTVDVFASDAALPDDTYEEFGLFCDGRLFARVVISPAYVKTTSEDTVFTYALTATG